jgi:deoxyribodipyrimidine photo-lyase
VCVYVYDPELRENRLPGAAARWWLHESLRELNAALGALGGGLAMFRGPERQVIEAFAAGIGAIKVCWNRRYSVAQRETDAAIKATLRECGIAVSTFNGHLLREPWSVATRDARRPFQVFSAYWRAARREYSPEPPRPAPGRIDFFPVPESAPARVNDLSALALQPYAPDWAGGLRETWQCGEEAGLLTVLRTIPAAPRDCRSEDMETAGWSHASRGCRGRLHSRPVLPPEMPVADAGMVRSTVSSTCEPRRQPARSAHGRR